MKKIAVITNFNIPEKARAALSVADKLNELGCEVYVASFNRERIGRNSGGVKRDYLNYIPIDKLFSVAELIIPLGGDGTILEVARRAVPAGKPMLGFNLGRVGYMATLEIEELDLLSGLFDGSYTIDERMMLNAYVQRSDGSEEWMLPVLNEIVLTRGTLSRMIDIELFCADEIAGKYRVEGLIFATPTGSTAYNMSAGGPVVDPSLDAVTVTPVCPHSPNSRPMVFGGTSCFTAKYTGNADGKWYDRKNVLWR